MQSSLRIAFSSFYLATLPFFLSSTEKSSLTKRDAKLFREAISALIFINWTVIYCSLASLLEMQEKSGLSTIAGTGVKGCD